MIFMIYIQVNSSKFFEPWKLYSIILHNRNINHNTLYFNNFNLFSPYFDYFFFVFTMQFSQVLFLSLYALQAAGSYINDDSQNEVAKRSGHSQNSSQEISSDHPTNKKDSYARQTTLIQPGSKSTQSAAEEITRTSVGKKEQVTSSTKHHHSSDHNTSTEKHGSSHAESKTKTTGNEVTATSAKHTHKTEHITSTKSHSKTE